MLSDIAVLGFIAVAALFLFGLLWACEWLAR
jgi:preprotein translocase subunit SecE